MKKTGMIVCLLFIGLEAFSQATVRIMDFSVFSEVSLTSPGGTGDSVNLRINFKINDAASATRAHIYLGTAPDMFDVFQAEALFTEQSGKYYLSCNGTSNEVRLSHCEVFLKISLSQYTSFSNATLFVETNDGDTGKLYYQK